VPTFALGAHRARTELAIRVLTQAMFIRCAPSKSWLSPRKTSHANLCLRLARYAAPNPPLKLVTPASVLLEPREPSTAYRETAAHRAAAAPCH
jgi:hypothetical protein